MDFDTLIVVSLKDFWPLCSFSNKTFDKFMHTLNFQWYDLYEKVFKVE